MITLEDYTAILSSKGEHLGEVRKNRADLIMNASFTGDIGYRKVYILTKDEGWHYVDAKFTKHAARSLSSDEVDSYLQFRPKVHYPVGSYVFIPDDTSYELNINEEKPFDGDVSDLWMIVARTNNRQFVQYLVLKCNWNLKWVVGYGDKRKVYHCWGCHRDANSYTSCDALAKHSSLYLETIQCISSNCWKHLRDILTTT